MALYRCPCSKYNLCLSLHTIYRVYYPTYNGLILDPVVRFLYLLSYILFCLEQARERKKQGDNAPTVGLLFDIYHYSQT